MKTYLIIAGVMAVILIAEVAYFLHNLNKFN